MLPIAHVAKQCPTNPPPNSAGVAAEVSSLDGPAAHHQWVVVVVVLVVAVVAVVVPEHQQAVDRKERRTPYSPSKDALIQGFSRSALGVYFHQSLQIDL